jgi:ubiquinone/menaquinone biosynthesis C-methylase UbiE
MKLNWAERWAVNNPLRVIQQRWEIRWMGKQMFLRPGAVVLEIGCGRGAGARLIREAFRPRVVHASDLDLEMIRMAREHSLERHGQGSSLAVADVFKLPYRNEAADAVFGFGVLHHVPDWRAAVAEIARMLKPGGLYFMEELYPSLYQNLLTKRLLLHPSRGRFQSGDLKQGLEEAGLPLQNFLEHKKLGILGIAVKTR